MSKLIRWTGLAMLYFQLGWSCSLLDLYMATIPVSDRDGRLGRDIKTYTVNSDPWTSPIVLAPFIIGILVLVTLGIYEWKFTKEGMFHHGLFS